MAACIVTCMRHRAGQVTTNSIHKLSQQVARLSQKGRVVLHVIEYFDKSLRVIQGHSK